MPLYEVLSRFVKEKKLKPGDIFQYAVYTWCLRNPAAIVVLLDYLETLEGGEVFTPMYKQSLALKSRSPGIWSGRRTTRC